jgi:hypothetical protein
MRAGDSTESEYEAVRPFEVGLEGMMFTLVDVHLGFDEAFERWYGSDHFYACGVLAPFVLAGSRWYGPAALRAARYCSADHPFASPGLGTNLAAYFLTSGGLDGYFAWVPAQLAALRGSDRAFTKRSHLDTQGYRFEGALAFPGASTIQPHLAGDHPFAGLVVTYLDASDESAPDTAARLPERTLALAFRPHADSPADVTPGLTVPAINGALVRLVLSLLTEAPPADAGWSADFADQVGRLSGCRAVWSGGFLPVTPGATDHLPSLRQ